MLTTIETIKKQSQQLARFERQLVRLKTKRRKNETHHKILLGSLVIKANLNQLSLEEFYHRLLGLKKRLIEEPALIQLYQYKGESIFMRYQSTQCSKSEERKPSFISETAQLNYLKQHIRRKIQLGGLVIKAQLPLTTKAQVLGALIDLKEANL